MVFSVKYTIREGAKLDCLVGVQELSHLWIVNWALNVNTSKFIKMRVVFTVGHVA